MYRQAHCRATLSTGTSPAKWWNLTAQALVNYKKLKGYVWNGHASDIWQFNISANNQFKISDRYTAELSGFIPALHAMICGRNCSLLASNIGLADLC